MNFKEPMLILPRSKVHQSDSGSVSRIRFCSGSSPPPPPASSASIALPCPFPRAMPGAPFSPSVPATYILRMRRTTSATWTPTFPAVALRMLAVLVGAGTGQRWTRCPRTRAVAAKGKAEWRRERSGECHPDPG